MIGLVSSKGNNIRVAQLDNFIFEKLTALCFFMLEMNSEFRGMKRGKKKGRIDSVINNSIG